MEVIVARQRGERTRNRIFRVAEECFASQGYDATGVAEICARASVTKGGFYHHFESKQALFLELLDRWLQLLDAQLSAIRSQAASAPESLIAMTEVVEPVFHEATSRLPLFLEFWRQASLDPVVWEAAVAPYRRYRALFADLIAEGVAQGSLQPTDPEVAAGTIVSLAVGLVMQGLMDPEGADWGRVAHQSMLWLVESLVCS
jgi:AcrR family transcriptional regulator